MIIKIGETTFVENVQKLKGKKHLGKILELTTQYKIKMCYLR
jgi:hypothetical protein